MIQSDTLSRWPDHHPGDDKPMKTTMLPKERWVAATKLDPEGGLFNEALAKKIVKTKSLDFDAREAMTLLLSLVAPSPLRPSYWEIEQTKHRPML